MGLENPGRAMVALAHLQMHGGNPLKQNPRQVKGLAGPVKRRSFPLVTLVTLVSLS